MNTHAKPNTGEPDEPARQKLVEFLALELFGDKASPSEYPKPSPIPDSTLSAIIADVQRGYKRSERWRLTSTDGSSNPLAGALQGVEQAVHIHRPDGSIAIDGRLITDWVQRKPEAPMLQAEEPRKLSADAEEPLSLSAADADADDFNLELWDDVERSLAASGSDMPTREKLWLVCPGWSNRWKLYDVVICSEDDSQPLAVLTVRRTNEGFELAFDSEDRDLLACDAIRVDLRLLPEEGA